MTTVSAGVNVHQLAQKGFGSGTNELYDRARPTYQSVVLSYIRKLAGGKDGLNVVELGAGTGIFTRALLAHADWQGSAIAQLKAVEPSEGMREQFAKTVTDPRVAGVEEGTFDRTGVSDGWADLVIIAQAFHWCPDHEAAVKEFGRILKPDGVVALVWNLEDRDTAQWIGQLRDFYEVYEQGSPQFRLGLWRAVFNVPSYPSLFAPSEEEVFAWDIPATTALVQDRACSKSYIAVLPPDEKSKVRDHVREIVERGDGKEWMDEKDGVFRYPYKTYVVSFKRK